MHMMPVVPAFSAPHAALSTAKHAMLLHAVQLSIEEWDACTLVSESPPQHVIAQPVLLVTKLSENAIIQKKCTAAAAGYNLCSVVDAVVPAQDKAIVHTDLAVAVPSET